MSHTKKILEFTVLKYRGAVTYLPYRPQNLTRAHYTRGPSICKPTCHVAPPHERPRALRCRVALPPRGGALRLLRPAWATRGPATWPQSRVASARWSRVPRVGSLASPLTTSAPTGKYPLFVVLLNNNSI